jgi:hypothetical protein
MLRICACMHSRFIENYLIRILEDEPLISEVVLSHEEQALVSQEVLVVHVV